MLGTCISLFCSETRIFLATVYDRFTIIMCSLLFVHVMDNINPYNICPLKTKAKFRGDKGKNSWRVHQRKSLWSSEIVLGGGRRGHDFVRRFRGFARPFL